MKKLKEILFLSDKGYTDLKKAIGAGWQDKKYNELGVVVRDCNKAIYSCFFFPIHNSKDSKSQCFQFIFTWHYFNWCYKFNSIAYRFTHIF